VAYPCSATQVRKLHTGEFALERVTHSIDRHGDKQNDIDELSRHGTQASAWAAAARLDVFA
jgi:hypothetical protein